jgi:hypothetical protein
MSTRVSQRNIGCNPQSKRNVESAALQVEIPRRAAAQIKRLRQIEINEGLRCEIILRPPRIMTVDRMLIRNQSTGFGAGKIWRLEDGATLNFFAEPQVTVAHDGVAPKFQLFFGLNMQFPIGQAGK